MSIIEWTEGRRKFGKSWLTIHGVSLYIYTLDLITPISPSVLWKQSPGRVAIETTMSSPPLFYYVPRGHVLQFQAIRTTPHTSHDSYSAGLPPSINSSATRGFVFNERGALPSWRTGKFGARQKKKEIHLNDPIILLGVMFMYSCILHSIVNLFVCIFWVN